MKIGNVPGLYGRTDNFNINSQKAVLSNKISFKSFKGLGNDQFIRTFAQKPKVSVIIPVYNVEKYLEKCLNSLQKQTLKDIEFICVDDGSTDNSLKILQKIASEDKRFKVFSQKNQGPGIARNLGLANAQGDYIGFCDPDDFVDEKMFETMFNKITKDNSDLLVSEYNTYYENGKQVKTKKIYETVSPYYDIRNNDNFTWKDIQPDVFIGLEPPVWNKMFKKSFLDENNIKFAAQRVGEDLPFNLKSILSAKKISYIETPMYSYFLRGGSAIHKKLKDFDAISVHSSIMQVIQEKGLESVLQNELDDYVARSIRFYYMRTVEDKKLEFKKLVNETFNERHKKIAFDAIDQVDKIQKEEELSTWQKIFSIRSEFDKDFMQRKILRLFGMKFVL